MVEETPLATFEFRRGALAGSHLSLFRTALVLRNADSFEAIPLDHIGALGVAFERDSGRMTRGFVLLIVAALMFAASWPLRSLVASALSDAIAQSQAGAFLPAALRAAELCIELLPYFSGAIAVWGLTGLAIGWVGETVLRVVVSPAERVYVTRGRDAALSSFTESVAARMAQRAN